MFQSIKKEALLLLRDVGALVILFAMPLLLVVTITLLQDGAFKNISEQKTAVLLVDNDGGEIAQNISKNLEGSAFQMVKTLNGKPISEAVAREEVLKGNYLLAIVIPSQLSSDLQNKVQAEVSTIINAFAGEEAAPQAIAYTAKEIRLYFDPTLQTSFKESVKSGIDKLLYQIENQFIYQAFERELDEGMTLPKTEALVSFREINPNTATTAIPNATQHNVPAWALFAIFFITIPLSASIVKEKTQGTGLRLFTSPLPYSALLTAKVIVFLMISLLQFGLMVVMGVFVFPYLGLPILEVSGKLLGLLAVAICSGLSAIGLGVLLGTLAKTQEQSAPLGATLTVLFAAIGGVWIPTFAMPHLMQLLSNISPMNWGLQAFYDVLLRDGAWGSLLPKMGALLLFFITCILISICYDKAKRNV
ncbi:ABC transporter [Capnocytophaga sp. HP1101]